MKREVIGEWTPVITAGNISLIKTLKSFRMVKSTILFKTGKIIP
jgi:hypothetical protein